jgi:uncharacterized protein
MSQRVPFLYISDSGLGGRGVFTGETLEEGDLIEICPAIVLPEEDLPKIHDTRLHDYYFLWGEEQNRCAIALGNGSLFNHSYQPNARYLLDYEHETIDFYAIKTIRPGEEITVNYNGDPEDQALVWFDKNLDRDI